MSESAIESRLTELVHPNWTEGQTCDYGTKSDAKGLSHRAAHSLLGSPLPLRPHPSPDGYPVGPLHCTRVGRPRHIFIGPRADGISVGGSTCIAASGRLVRRRPHLA